MLSFPFHLPDFFDCYFDGNFYEDGSNFTKDACNNCTCRAGLLRCTELTCGPPPMFCVHEGQTVMAGESLWTASETECLNCTCLENGTLVCVDIQCPTEVPPPSTTAAPTVTETPSPAATEQTTVTEAATTDSASTAAATTTEPITTTTGHNLWMFSRVDMILRSLVKTFKRPVIFSLQNLPNASTEKFSTRRELVSHPKTAATLVPA